MISKIEDELLDRMNIDDIIKFNNYQFTEYIKEHNEEFSQLLRKLENRGLL
jgi:hypothetical protein